MKAVSDPTAGSASDLQLVIQQVQMDVGWDTCNGMPFRRVCLLERPTGLELYDIHRCICHNFRSMANEQQAPYVEC